MTGVARAAGDGSGTDRRAQLLEAASELLERGGPDALTIRALGSAVGIKGPSVYKHFADKTAVEDALTVAILRERAAELAEVGQTFSALAAAMNGDTDLARAAWATITGLVDLELADRFRPGTDLAVVYAAAARAYDGARPRRTGRRR